ncbi:MAG TPA: Holliday junction resolvase RuvX [Candidatus Hydrogenedens sp.]|nr:Holliday junction resolvase RuvX [Candidatus Hydrogenedens sp.]
MNEGRILAIDYGEVRIGLAISDPLGLLAFPLMVIDLKKTKDYIKVIKDVIKEKEVKKIIIGLPLTMEGKEGIQTEKVRRFYEDVKECVDLAVELVDERLTTVIAQKSLSEVGIDQRKQRKMIDMVAAAKLLETYLESKSKE